MKKWRVVLVLPQAHWVLEARLRGWRSTRLVSSFFILPSSFEKWCGCRESHPDFLRGGEAFCC
jgi:hypothetical protein